MQNNFTDQRSYENTFTRGNTVKIRKHKAKKIRGGFLKRYKGGRFLVSILTQNVFSSVYVLKVVSSKRRLDHKHYMLNFHLKQMLGCVKKSADQSSFSSKKHTHIYIIIILIDLWAMVISNKKKGGNQPPKLNHSSNWIESFI